MTTLFLIRHGSNDFFTHTIVGRSPGIHLNDVGRKEAEALVQFLSRHPVEKIFSSPLERCRETAGPLARELKLEVQIAEELNEVDFGEWTGKRFAELNSLESWKQWNAFRSRAKIPGGESMMEAQARMVLFAEKVRRGFPNQKIALVSHGDPLRALILHYLGMPLDFIHRIELSPASVSIVEVDDASVQVRCLNARPGSATIQS